MYEAKERRKTETNKVRHMMTYIIDWWLGET